MKITIIKDEEKGEKSLYLNGIFKAAWDISVDAMGIIVPYALDECVEIGRQELQKQLRELLRL